MTITIGISITLGLTDMVKFEKQYIALLKGTWSFTGGDNDPMMNRVVSYVENEIKVHKQAILELEGVTDVDLLKHDLERFQSALKAYYQRKSKNNA